MWIARDIDEGLEAIQLPVPVRAKASEMELYDPNWSLVRGCLDGDSRAQRKLFDQLLPYLKSAVRRYIWSEADVQDVLQETFLRIFRHLHQYDRTKGQVQTWATKVAINAAITFGTKKVIKNDLERVPEPQVHQPEVLAKLDAEGLLERLKALPRDQYNVLILHAVDGYSHDEIAVMLDITPATSRKRLSRAKQWILSRFDLDGGEMILKKSDRNEMD